MTNTIKKSVAICSVIASTFLISCTNAQNKTNEHQHQTEITESVYACPMHPEITGKKGDKCSKCGMNLEAVRQPKQVEYQMNLTTLPKTIKPNEPTQLILDFSNNGKKAELEVSHEKELHLIVVNDELTWFHHIHPTKQENGSYAVTETFPNADKYLLFADYKPKGAEHGLNKAEIFVHGKQTNKPDTTTNKWVSNVDGYTVILVNGNDFKTNRPQHIGISVEQNGKFLTGKDIELYLGAVAHVVLISKQDKEFKHVHPISNEKLPIHGETFFDHAGVYRIWVQFQTSGQLHTADFTINVEQGNKKNNAEMPTMHHH